MKRATYHLRGTKSGATGALITMSDSRPGYTGATPTSEAKREFTIAEAKAELAALKAAGYTISKGHDLHAVRLHITGLPEPFHRDIKTAAARAGMTLREWVIRSLQNQLDRNAEAAPGYNRGVNGLIVRDKKLAAREGRGEHKMKTEFDHGREYAQWQGAYAKPVDIEAMLGQTSDIPDRDYTEMKRAGIENPSARLYWEGFNSIF